MVYDCFTFFNELDLLEIRLNVLKDVVDKFVLVEAGETHTGKPKPFYFEENKSRFAEFADRIIHVKIEKFPAVCGTSWARENWQRNRIDEGLKVCAKDDDLILISDVDEIPNPELVAKDVPASGVTIYNQRYYAFYLNYDDVRQQYWYGTRRVRYRDFLHAYDGVKVLENEILPSIVNEGTTASKIRCRHLPRSRGGEKVMQHGGWHFTCLGGAKAVVRKMQSVVPHHDFNPDDQSLTEERVAKLILKGQGPALKMNCFAVPFDCRFPRYVLEHREKFSHLIFEVTPEYLRRVRASRFLRTVQGWFKSVAERNCPPMVHNWLHLMKMRLLGRGGSL